MHVCSTELFSGDYLACGSLHQRRSAEINGSLVSNDDGLVAHSWDVGTACGTHTHHDSDLWYSHRRHTSLIIEETTEVVSVREHRILFREEGAATVDHIDARQFVLHRDFLCAKMFLHGILHIGAAFDSSVIGNDYCFSALDGADTSDDTRRWKVVVISVVSRHRREFQERSVLIDEQVDTLACKEFVTFLMFLNGRSATALHTHRHAVAIARHQLHVGFLIILKFLTVRIYL